MTQVQMQPYSVSQGKKYTDWWAELTILQELKEKGIENWTMEETNYFYKMHNQAYNWVTCACGNMCDIIPRDNTFGNAGAPLDHPLRDLGIEFPRRIGNLDIDGAVNVLNKIEERSEYLIKQIMKEKLANEK